MKKKLEFNSNHSHIFDPEQIPLGFVALDLEGRVLTANRLLADLLATDRRELPGRFFADHIVVADRAMLQKHFDELLAGKNITCRLRIAKPDGANVWIRLESVLLDAAYILLQSILLTIRRRNNNWQKRKAVCARWWRRFPTWSG